MKLIKLPGNWLNTRVHSWTQHIIQLWHSLLQDVEDAEIFCGYQSHLENLMEEKSIESYEIQKTLLLAVAKLQLLEPERLLLGSIAPCFVSSYTVP